MSETNKSMLKASEPKPLWQSMTLWATLFALLGVIMPYFGFGKVEDWKEIGDSFQNVLVALFQFLGIIFAFIGRVQATRQVSVLQSYLKLKQLVARS